MIKSNFDKDKNRLLFTFTGRLDSVAILEVEKAVSQRLNALESPEADVQFDLAAVDYISSAFIKLAVVAAGSLKGGKLSIINTSPHIKKLLKMAGVDRAMEVL